LFLFVGAAAQERPAFVVVDGLLEHLTGRPLPKPRSLVEIGNDAPAQEPEVIDMPPNRLWR
jgi:hypothetical protein